MDNFPQPLKVFFFFVIPFFTGLFLFSGILINQNDADTDEERRNYYQVINNDKKATEATLSLLTKDSLNFSIHAEFLNELYELDNKDKSLLENQFNRNFNQSPIQFYRNTIDRAIDSNEYNLGYFGLAKIYLEERGYSFDEIQSKIAKINTVNFFVDKLKGDFYFRFHQPEEAVVNYLNALEKEPKKTQVIEGLVKSYLFLNEYKKALDWVWKDESIHPSIGFYVAQKNSGIDVVKYSYWREWTSLLKLASLASLSIMCFWLVFIYFLRGNLKGLNIAFILIGIFSLLSTPLIFMYSYSISKFLGEIENSFLNNLFYVASIEELIKIFPIILVYFIFRKKANLNKLDLLFWGIFSASFFAFSENNFYFNSYYDSSIVFGRFVNASFIHVICTSFLIMGIFYSTFFKNKTFLKWPLIMSAFIIHSIYNSFLEWGIGGLSQIIVLISFSIWIVLLNRTFKQHNLKILQTNFNIKLSNLILISFPLIILVQYVLTSVELGVLTGNEVLHSSIQSSGIMILVCAASVLKINDFKFFYLDVFSLNKLKSKSTLLQLKSYDALSSTNFPDSIIVKVNSKIKDKNKKFWYIVECNEDKFLLKMKNQYDDIDEFNIEVFCRKIEDNFPKLYFSPKDFKYLGIVKCSPYINPAKEPT